MKEEDLEKWIHENICEEFQDWEVNELYGFINELNEDLIEKMLTPENYKAILKNIKRIKPNLVEHETIQDHLKDMILIGGSQSYIIDDYMDWYEFTEDEIREWYIKYREEYIRYEDLQEIYDLIEECIT